MNYPCPTCGKTTDGSYSPAGRHFEICDACMTEQLRDSGYQEPDTKDKS